jgi:hypothetical protein
VRRESNIITELGKNAIAALGVLGVVMLAAVIVEALK